MKILFESLKRTHLGFPSEWEGKTEDDENVLISYRYGEIQIFVDEQLKTKTEKDGFDIGGYLSDEELKLVLIRDKLIKEED